MRESKYDTEKIDFLENGLKNGFDIGYTGPEKRSSTSDNIPFTVGNEVQLWNKLMKEVKLKRVAGPFKNVPFDDYIQSPIGLVPKGDENSGQTRLIFHLSYDCKRDGMKSLNSHTPRELCTVKYKDLDFAVRAYLTLSQSLNDPESNDEEEEEPSGKRRHLSDKWRSKFQHHKRVKTVVYAGKSDLRSAFRLLGLSPSSWRWLVMKARDPKTREWNYFVDKCLPFGASISCALFQKFSDALCHIYDYQARTQS